MWASLVPAAAVIPAYLAYIKVVAVKKLVVGFLQGTTIPLSGWISWLGPCIFPKKVLYLIVWGWTRFFYFEEIRVFQAGLRLEYISME